MEFVFVFVNIHQIVTTRYLCCMNDYDRHTSMIGKNKLGPEGIEYF